MLTASSESGFDNSETAVPENGASHESCPECLSRNQGPVDQYVYAVGRVEVRLPSLALEREFQHRGRMLGSAIHKPRLEHMREILEQNPHIAGRACYLLTVGGSPAYMLMPAGAYVRKALFDALTLAETSDAYAVVIGRLGGMAPPQACGGVLAPIVICDQIYTFRVNEWLSSLTSTLKTALKERSIEHERFTEIATRLLSRLIQSSENVGATDIHRALNYVLMQHPGVFLLAAEENDRCTLDRIDTRIVQAASSRKQVVIIFCFVELSTGINKRFFTRIDVTEEWPFASDMDGGLGPVGLTPYVENSLLGLPL